MDHLALFKVKADIKETGLSPYQIPFNYEILQEKQRMDPSNKDSFRQYLLPDGKTLATIDIGITEKEIMNELIGLYRNSNKLGEIKLRMQQHNDERKSWGGQAKSQPLQNQLKDNGKKSLAFKIDQTARKFCREECIDHEAIDYILLTGGGLKLKSQDGLKLNRVIQKEIEKVMMKDFPNIEINSCDEPHVGSILNGGKLLFSMSQFDQVMSVSRKEWQQDDQVVIKKLF
uniref:Uncharacterized protein n=1 Tax=Strombidium rassoulzadegani TaxID=1082188 RepID=A0A7S3CRA7_9SPIT|mmetsp:Transcript_5137/g.8737  ORF Transcript_5137/g.8737 Transcript_5137/m.8737 type:complete len:230 (+) Transcript_5137:777-1466(+)